jgi:uncharacterized protein
MVIIRILLFLFSVYLFRWFIAGFKKSPKKTQASDGANTNRMVKDPVCGMYMDARLAIRLDSRSEAVYFCSEECKKKYMNKSADEEMPHAVVD